MRIFGVDFSSSPTRRKPIVVASAKLSLVPGLQPAWSLKLESFEKIHNLDAFSDWLTRPGPWVAGFDFPFALPREFLMAFGWPPYAKQQLTSGDHPWADHVEHLSRLSRAELVAAFKSFCAGRPVGGKFAHRACDIPAGASPSMKWVNPPVAYMLHAGGTRLHQAGVMVPGLKQGDATRVALEAYPGYLARKVLGRESYKSDDSRKQDKPRQTAREALILALLQVPLSKLGLLSAAGFNLALKSKDDTVALCANDGTGDHLDAWLCAIQACVGYICEIREPGSQYGMGEIDPLEGWIVSVVRD
jgi:hypothetical protein